MFVSRFPFGLRMRAAVEKHVGDELGKPRLLNE
jgi:hypothetical protein